MQTSHWFRDSGPEFEKLRTLKIQPHSSKKADQLCRASTLFTQRRLAEDAMSSPTLPLQDPGRNVHACHCSLELKILTLLLNH